VFRGGNNCRLWEEDKQRRFQIMKTLVGIMSLGGQYCATTEAVLFFSFLPFFFFFSYIQVNQGRNEIALHAIQSLIFA
jgi:hypothetical protein